MAAGYYGYRAFPNVWLVRELRNWTIQRRFEFEEGVLSHFKPGLKLCLPLD